MSEGRSSSETEETHDPFVLGFLTKVLCRAWESNYLRACPRLSPGADPNYEKVAAKGQKKTSLVITVAVEGKTA